MNKQGQDAVTAFHITAFRSWLLARQSVVVGCPGSERECPLACFLSEITGRPYAVVSEWYYPVGMPTFASLLPLWAATFMQSLDFTYPLEWVTGEQTSALLSFTGVSEEYCWMHNPGGWSCAECFQSGQIDGVQSVTREGGLYV